MYSAGILIYTILNNELYFLLGKDTKWKQWSDFGGKNDPMDDNNISNTACREFYEETMGVLFDICQIRQKIKQTPYIKSLSFKLHDYYMYPIYINYTEVPIKEFDILFNFELSVPLKYKEKMEIKWISLENILKKKYNTRVVFYNTICNNLKIINDLKVRRFI